MRWAGWTALAVLAGLAAAMLLERRGPLEQRVLSRVPAGASIVGYAELGPLRDSKLLGRLIRERLLRSAGLSLVEPDVDAIAVAVGADEIVGLAAGRFPFALVRRYLEQQGARCPAPLDERACALATSGGFLSIRGLAPGLLGVANGPRADAADELAGDRLAADPRLAARARAALDAGVLVWVSIDPRRLAETMSDPPEGWINLSLLARALLTADSASLDLEDEPDGTAVRATLRAACPAQADAVELAKMLESLNGLLAAALGMGGSQRSQAWARALDEGFLAETHDKTAAASWSLPGDLLRESIELELGR
jgi:hypothetical protein